MSLLVQLSDGVSGIFSGGSRIGQVWVWVQDGVACELWEVNRELGDLENAPNLAYLFEGRNYGGEARKKQLDIRNSAPNPPRWYCYTEVLLCAEPLDLSNTRIGRTREIYFVSPDDEQLVGYVFKELSGNHRREEFLLVEDYSPPNYLGEALQLRNFAGSPSNAGAFSTTAMGEGFVLRLRVSYTWQRY